MTEQIENKEKICGIIRPIAKMSDFYTFEHWNSVKDIMERAITKAGYNPLTVSDSKGSTTIHSSIFLNLYQNEIVVCDVSNRNANVMFELGMRIAFDKPVVIIKDEKTPFSFDTSHIKHLEYPSDLRFQVIEKFIDDLASLILETVQASKQKEYKTFLSHYAPIKVTTLEVNEVSEKIALESILKSIHNLEEKVNTLNSKSNEIKPKSLGLSDLHNSLFNTQGVNRLIFDFDKPIKIKDLDIFASNIKKLEGIDGLELLPNKITVYINPFLDESKKIKLKFEINKLIDEIP